MADVFAYEATGPGNEFGIIDLTTGVFTPLSNMGLTLAGTGDIGNTYLLFGSTTSGPCGVGWNDVLYSINPATGAATEIGSTGLPIGGVMGMSAGGNTLYVTANNALYALSTTTGAATFITTTNEGVACIRFG